MGKEIFPQCRNSGNETWHVLYLLENQPRNNDDYVILKRFRAHLHCNKIREVWQHSANISSCMLCGSRTWILIYNKYCTGPRGEPKTSSFKEHHKLCTCLLHNIASLIWSGAQQILWIVNVNAGSGTIHVKGVDILVLLHRRTSLIIPPISPQQGEDPQSSVSRIMKSHNYKVVSLPYSKAGLNTSATHL